MRFKVAFADLHSPLFMEGKDFGNKIGKGQNKTPPELVLTFCTKMRVLIAKYKTKASLIPEANIASMTPENPLDVEVEVDKPQAAVKPLVTPPPAVGATNPMTGSAPIPRNPAQVEMPMVPPVGNTGVGQRIK